MARKDVYEEEDDDEDEEEEEAEEQKGKKKKTKKKIKSKIEETEDKIKELKEEQPVIIARAVSHAEMFNVINDKLDLLIAYLQPKK